MAEVYRASMPGPSGFSKTVAIKRLLPRFANDPERARLFIEEAKLAAQVQHKNVVQVYELDQLDNGELYMAMEWVEGIDLSSLIQRAADRAEAIPPWLCVHIMCEVLEALAHAHSLLDDAGNRRNIVHCDVTPENIFLSKLGDVKLADFGVALDDSRADPATPSIKGKLPYMSPEQISGQRPDQRADVFQSAVVLWESLTLMRLFSGKSTEEITTQIRMGKRTPPSQYMRGISPALDRAVLRALEPASALRTPTARAFQAELFEILADIRPRFSIVDVGAALERIVGDNFSRRPQRGLDAEEPVDIAEVFADAFDMSDTPTPPDGSQPIDVERDLDPDPGIYSYINPKHAVDKLGPKLNVPIPMPGRPSNVETGDLVNRTRPKPIAPIRAAPSRANTGDMFEKVPKRTPGTLYVRTSGTRVLGPVGALDVLGALADMLEAETPARAEVSGDGVRWLPWPRFCELLGEPIAGTAPVLPRNNFTGALERISLPSVFGQLARSRATGHLILVAVSDRGIDRREIHVREGTLTCVTSNRRQLGAWPELTRLAPDVAGEAAQLVQAVAEQARPLWELASEQFLARLTEARGRVTQATLTEVFSWAVGDFGFDPAGVPAVSAAPVSMFAVLPGVVARTKSPAQLKASMMRVLDVPLSRSDRFTREVDALQLNRAPQLFASTFGSGRTLGESFALCNTPEEERIALVVAYLLMELGLLSPSAPSYH